MLLFNNIHNDHDDDDKDGDDHDKDGDDHDNDGDDHDKDGDVQGLWGQSRESPLPPHSQR